MRPEPIQAGAGRVESILTRALTRIRVRHTLRALAAGVLVAVVALIALTILGVRGNWSTGLLTASAISALLYLHFLRGERTARAAAAAIEHADPSLQNLVFTAAQLLESAEGTRPYMRERVFREAAARAAAVDLRKAVPLARDGAILAVAVAAIAVVAIVRVPAASVLSSLAGGRVDPLSRSPASTDLVVELSPPSYTGRAASRLVNPATLDVLGGTQAVVRFGLERARLRVNGTMVAMGQDGARVTFNESGYLALEAGSVHRLVPLTVTPDRAPDVRVTAPAKDLRVPSTAASIPITATAADDLGLGSFELRYTIVSGTGEQFSFTEGTLPSVMQRGSDRAWRLDATLSLARLGLEPGDALIYRAVAADRRPAGAGLAASDTFFVEIAGPGDVPLEGVEMPPEKERYALSQAMIVLKLERLQARERALAEDALADETGNIAAEQRAVRANFIFLLGGEVEDEEVEAEHSHEISEGRFANQARKEIVTATVLMGQVEKALAAVSTREALPPARAAVQALQRAFGHSRYLLRALPSRVRLDPARRQSGDITTASDWNRALAPSSSDPVTEAARAALTDLIAASAALHERANAASITTVLRELEERILAAAAAATDLQPAAKEVAAARAALASGQIDAARAALRRAAPPLLNRAQQNRILAGSVSRDAARLAGAAAIGGGGTR